MNCGTTQVEMVMMRRNTDAFHNTNNLELPSYEITNTHTLPQGEQPHDMLRDGASAKWMMRCVIQMKGVYTYSYG